MYTGRSATRNKLDSRRLAVPPPEAHRSILKPATKLSVGTSKPRMPTYSSFFLTDGFCGAASY